MHDAKTTKIHVTFLQLALRYQKRLIGGRAGQRTVQVMLQFHNLPDCCSSEKFGSKTATLFRYRKVRLQVQSH